MKQSLKSLRLGVRKERIDDRQINRYRTIGRNTDFSRETNNIYTRQSSLPNLSSLTCISIKAFIKYKYNAT
jgi:exosome complex RNA-binding protein Rrp42 (RNase PH superfamily)